MIITHSKLGETTVISEDADIVTLYLKHIPTIGEVGISIKNDGRYEDCWIDLNCSDYENIYEIECIYPWLNIGQAESLISRLKEWVK